MESKEQVEALASIPEGITLLRMELETMMAAAVKRPRDLEEVSKNLVRQIKTFPAFAEQVLYARPVGKDEETGQQKVATGLSIRAAEAIAEAYGANATRSSIELLPDGNARVTGVFVDYQNFRMLSETTMVSRTYKTRQGKMVTHPQDRFLNVVCKAERSKVIRDAILRAVPPALKATMELAVKTSVRISEKVVEQIVAYFAQHQVTVNELETFLGAPRGAWSDVHRERLAQVRNAITPNEDGVVETTIEDVFGLRPQKSKTANGNGGQASAAGAVADALTHPEEATAEAAQHHA